MHESITDRLRLGLTLRRRRPTRDGEADADGDRLISVDRLAERFVRRGASMGCGGVELCRLLGVVVEVIAIGWFLVCLFGIV